MKKNAPLLAGEVIDASVMQAGDEASVFCGASGSGKSSLAAWLIQREYPLVCDDLCCFDLPGNGPARVYPSAPRLKLWRDTLEALGQDVTGLERDHFRLERPAPIGNHCHLPARAARTTGPDGCPLATLSGPGAQHACLSILPTSRLDQVGRCDGLAN